MIIDMPTVSMGNSGSILPAEKVSYDNTSSGLEAENVQDAVDEINSNFNYSTDEVIIGKFYDGRPVYRRFIPIVNTYTVNTSEWCTIDEIVLTDVTQLLSCFVLNTALAANTFPLSAYIKHNEGHQLMVMHNRLTKNGSTFTNYAMSIDTYYTFCLTYLK